MDKKIFMDMVNYPIEIRVNGEVYSVVCAYVGKDGKDIEILQKDEAQDVIVRTGDGFTIAGLFSTEDNKLKMLASFIEATVDRKEGFYLTEVNFFQSLKAVTKQKNFPFLYCAAEWNMRPSLFQNMVMNFREANGKRTLLLELLKQMKEHTVSVEFAGKEGLDEKIKKASQQEESCEEHQSKPTISPAKTLPEGWEWHSYPDEACGSLMSPDGKSYFSYDLAPHTSQGGIEYKKEKESGWDIHWGTLSDFKENAESSIKRKLDLTLGEIYLPKIMSEMEQNAWYGQEPRKVCISAGEHVIEIEGYTYEQSYEYFTADSSITFDGTVLYEKDSRCVGPYRYETYHKGSFESYEEAVAFMKEQTVGLEYELVSEAKETLENKIQAVGEKIQKEREKTAGQKTDDRGNQEFYRD